jgi:hypothetical protein
MPSQVEIEWQGCRGRSAHAKEFLLVLVAALKSPETRNWRPATSLTISYFRFAGCSLVLADSRFSEIEIETQKSPIPYASFRWLQSS